MFTLTCQGLVYHGDFLYESCGLNRRSIVKKIDQTTNKVMATYKFTDDIFAEGITYYDNHIFLITYKNKRMYILSADELLLVGTRHYTVETGEGWGLTHTQSHLILSDGSSNLYYYNYPANYSLHYKEYPHLTHHALELVKQVSVKVPTTNKEVEHINELEYANGYIYANIWYQDVIVKIDPTSGYIVNIYDMSTLFPTSSRPRNADCLNGIAYHTKGDYFYITGKFWPYAYIGQFLNATDVNITDKWRGDSL